METRLGNTCRATLGVWLTSALGSVSAGLPGPIAAPEPGALGLLAGGVAAVVIAARLRKRK